MLLFVIDRDVVSIAAVVCLCCCCYIRQCCRCYVCCYCYRMHRMLCSCLMFVVLCCVVDVDGDVIMCVLVVVVSIADVVALLGLLCMSWLLHMLMFCRYYMLLLL